MIWVVYIYLLGAFVSAVLTGWIHKEEYRDNDADGMARAWGVGIRAAIFWPLLWGVVIGMVMGCYMSMDREDAA